MSSSFTALPPPPPALISVWQVSRSEMLRYFILTQKWATHLEYSWGYSNTESEIPSLTLGLNMFWFRVVWSNNAIQNVWSLYINNLLAKKIFCRNNQGAHAMKQKLKLTWILCKSLCFSFVLVTFVFQPGSDWNNNNNKNVLLLWMGHKLGPCIRYTVVVSENDPV